MPLSAILSNPELRRELLGWDITNWHRAIKIWDEALPSQLSQVRVLEIGAGFGGMSLLFAMAGAQVVYSGPSGKEPLADALHQKYANHVQHKIEYATIDCLNIPYADQFDIVVCKTVLGHIGVDGGFARQKDAVTQMHKALKPGGHLFLGENLIATPFHHFLRTHFGTIKKMGGWRYPTYPELLEMLTPFSEVQYECLGFLGLFGFNESLRTQLGWLDRVLLNPLVPKRWRYIFTCVAKK